MNEAEKGSDNESEVQLRAGISNAPPIIFDIFGARVIN